MFNFFHPVKNIFNFLKIQCVHFVRETFKIKTLSYNQLTNFIPLPLLQLIKRKLGIN